MALRSSQEVWSLLVAETNARPEGDGYRALCPTHEDANESLYLTKGEKGILLHCHAGCSGIGIAYHFGITKTELFFEQFRVTADTHTESRRKKRGPIVAEYDYRDESGVLLFQVCRHFPPKDFSQRSPDSKGGWRKSLKDVRRVVYRLPELLAANQEHPVFVTEGEKDADRLRSLGFTATTNPGGCGKWKDEFADSFKGFTYVVVIPDNHAEGIQHAAAVIESLKRAGVPAKLLHFSDVPNKGDVSDWLDAGGTAEQLVKLATDLPIYDPDKEKPAVISNYIETSDGKEPLTMERIVADIQRATGDWPRRVGKTLFVPHEIESIYFLDSESSMLEFISESIPFTPKFASGPGLHPKKEVYSAMQRRAKAYKQIENFPHEPMIASHYYTCEPPATGDGKYLDRFVDFFSPATSVDRCLIKAMVVTAFWGGRGGKRPLFVITSDTGRGSGKSILVEMIGQLCGGVISVSNNEKMEDIKKRLLSEDGAMKRIVILDNVKSSRFSWAELEAVITAREISGWKLWKGDGARPNTITWTMTINGASFGTDIAERAIIIKITKPKYSAGWTEQVESFIETHRQAIISDCVGFLRGPIRPLSRPSRWNDWEKAMLHRFTEGDEIQQVIHDRRNEANVETEEGKAIEDHFRQRLVELGYSPDGEQVWIPSVIATKWMNESLGERKTVTACSRMLKQKITEKEIENLQISRNNSFRGFIWSSPICSIDSPVDRDLEYRIDMNRKGTQGV